MLRRFRLGNVPMVRLHSLARICGMEYNMLQDRVLDASMPSVSLCRTEKGLFIATAHVPLLIADHQHAQRQWKQFMSINEAFKRRLTPSERMHVAVDQQWRCAHCQNLLDATFEVDHKEEYNLRSNSQASNLQALCPPRFTVHRYIVLVHST